MTKREFSPHVIEALETLARASTPGALGLANQTLLDWRPNAPRSARRVNIKLRDLMTFLVWFACVAMAYFFVQWTLSTESAEFQRGFLTALGIGLAFMLLSSILHRSPDQVQPTPLSIDFRIEAAINCWRHLAPAMKELSR